LSYHFFYVSYIKITLKNCIISSYYLYQFIRGNTKYHVWLKGEGVTCGHVLDEHEEQEI